MLVLATDPPHYLFPPIILNSLDRESVRLVSPHDSQITSKTRCRCLWCQCRGRDRTQVGVRRGFETLLCFLSGRSVEEPSWGDRGSMHLGLSFFIWFRSQTLIVFWMMYAIYLCIVWSGDCKPTLYPFLIRYMGCVKITPLATCLLCGYASKSCSDTWEI